jgi:hypothetical protein
MSSEPEENIDVYYMNTIQDLYKRIVELQEQDKRLEALCITHSNLLLEKEKRISDLEKQVKNLDHLLNSNNRDYAKALMEAGNCIMAIHMGLKSVEEKQQQTTCFLKKKFGDQQDDKK